jgi:hypothetical protein
MAGIARYLTNGIAPGRIGLFELSYRIAALSYG